MLPHSFWSNRQLLMCSICPPQLPACPRVASASGEQSLEQVGVRKSPYSISSVTPRPPHPPLGYLLHHSPARPPQSPVALLQLYCISAFEGLRKFKPLCLVLSQRWMSCSILTQEHGSTVTCPLLSVGA